MSAHRRNTNVDRGRSRTISVAYMDSDAKTIGNLAGYQGARRRNDYDVAVVPVRDASHVFVVARAMTADRIGDFHVVNPGSRLANGSDKGAPLPIFARVDYLSRRKNRVSEGADVRRLMSMLAT
jgi:hypothetical protein